MKWKKSERNDLEEEYPFWRHGGTLCLNRKWIKIGPTRTVANGEEKEIATRRRISRKHETKTNEKARETKLCLYAFLVIIFSDDLLSFIDIFLNASRFSHTTLLVREAVKAAAAAYSTRPYFGKKISISDREVVAVVGRFEINVRARSPLLVHPSLSCVDLFNFETCLWFIRSFLCFLYLWPRDRQRNK